MNRFTKLLAGAATTAIIAGTASAQDCAEPIKVGVLHSLSGTMAISETTLKDTMEMLVAAQNEKGGVLGCELEAVVVDPASDWPLFAEKARVDALVHTIPDGILMASFDGEILYVNNSARTLLGMEPMEDGEEPSPGSRAMRLHDVFKEPKLKEMTLKVGAKVGESGKIFGSVNNIQLAEEINKLGIQIDRKNVKLKDEPIKTTGTYEAEVTFHREVIETISFEVVGE